MLKSIYKMEKVASLLLLLPFRFPCLMKITGFSKECIANEICSSVFCFPIQINDSRKGE